MLPTMRSAWRFRYRRLFILLKREGEPSGLNPHLSAASRGRVLVRAEG